MVDLLRNVERLDVVSPGAQSSVSPGYVKSAFSELARGLESLGNTLGEQQQQREGAEAKIAGENAVYRDAQGQLTFDPRPLNRNGILYNDAARTAYLSRMEPEVQGQIQQGVISSNGNVASFDTWNKAYRAQVLKGKDPIMAGPLATLLDHEYGVQREGMIRQRQATDLKSHFSDIKDQLQRSSEDAAALARTGGTDTPEYKGKVADAQSLVGQLTGNPLFGVSAHEGDMLLRDMQSKNAAEAVIGNMEKVYNDPKNGGLLAAQKFAQTAFDDPNLPLSPADRLQYKNTAMQALKGFQAESRADLQDARLKEGMLLDDFHAGIAHPDAEVDALASRLNVDGDPYAAMSLRRKAEYAKLIGPGLGDTPEERVQRAQQITQGGRGGAGSGQPGSQQFFRQRAQGGISDAAISQTNPIFRDRLQTALTAAEQATGGKATITSMFRSHDEQQAAYDRFQAGTGGRAAHPGHSRHEIGQAADLAAGPVLDWLHQHAGEYGLEFLPSRLNDPGHIQMAAGEPAATGVPSGAAKVIGHFEGLRFSSYPDKGGYRIGYGSDTITHADGTDERVRPGMRITQADADHDLARRIPIFEAQERAQVGGASWDALDPRTKAVLTSVAYNYGSLPPEIVTAVKTGDNETIATAVEGLSSNPGRRRQEAAIIRGQAIGAGGGEASAVPPEVLKTVHTKIGEDAVKTADGIIAGLKRNEIPDASSMQLFAQEVGISGNTELWTEKVRPLLEATEKFVPQDLAAMDATMAEAQKNGVSIGGQDIMEMMQSVRQKTAEGLKKDPVALAASRQTAVVPNLPPIDFSMRPADLGTQMARRQAALGVYRQAYPDTRFPAFNNNEAAAFNTAVSSGDPQQVANALGSLSTLGVDTLVRTLEMPEVKQAITGAIGSRSFPLWDQAMRAVDGAYAKAPADVERALGKETIDALQDWQGKERYYSPEQMQEQFDKMNDPAFAKQQKVLLDDGLQMAREESVKDFGNNVVGHRVSVPNIVTALESFSNKLSPSLLGGQYAPVDSQTLNTLRSDYEKIYAERYAATQDKDIARTQTIERLSHVWGFSPANGGKLMLHPPENFDAIPEMKAVNGSKEWIGQQLDQALRDLGYVGGEQVTRFSSSRPVLPHAIIADAQTQAEIDAGKKPTYAVVVLDKEGNYAVPMAFGNVKRFAFDNRLVPIDRSGYQRTHALSDKINEGAPTLEGGAGFGAIDPAGPQPVAPSAEGGGGIGQGAAAGTQLVPESPGTLKSLRPPENP